MNFLTNQRASYLWLAWNAKESEALPDILKDDAREFLEYLSSKPPLRFALLSLMLLEGIYPSSIKPEELTSLVE